MFYSATQTMQFYAQSLVQLLIEPGQFYARIKQSCWWKKGLGFLLISCGFFTTAVLLTGIYNTPVWPTAMAVFSGTAGTVLVSAFLGYLTMVVFVGRAACFSKIFSLYAFSCGITLYLSWLPFLLWMTEAWKCWLIYTGFRTICNIKGRQSLAILAVSMTVQFFLMVSLNQAFSG